MAASSAEGVRAEIERDESARQDALFICFWHQNSNAVQWLEPGKVGLEQLDQQQVVFAGQGLEVHGSIWSTTGLAGAHFVIEFRSFGPTGENAVQVPDPVALALSGTTIRRRYVYAVCRHLGKVTEEERQQLLSNVQGALVTKQNPEGAGLCACCGQRKLPVINVIEPGEGYNENGNVTIHNATVRFTASGGGVVSAEFQRLPDVPDATGLYEVDVHGLTRKFGTGGGAGAKVQVQDLLPLSQCSRCQSVRYCSSACQKAHWRDHKLKCASAK